ncbi:MAG: hypothetical protein ACKOER_01870 [Betaproteobacteria bacterium]
MPSAPCRLFASAFALAARSASLFHRRSAWAFVVAALHVLMVLAAGVLYPWTAVAAQTHAGPSSAVDHAGAQPWPCLSYAPFRRHGHSPLDASLRLTQDQLREDLQMLSQWTGCIRTYGTGHGQDQIPVVAQALGLQVVQGAWISRDRSASQAEVDTALALARAFPSTVRMLVLGNEVLLRREQSPEDLARILGGARRVSPVPVAYADVWEFWLRHAPVLATEVDVVAIHILPYWEDSPVALDLAVGHVLTVHAQVKRAFGNQAVWLAETGWPAAGRARAGAVPGPQQQARFLRELRQQLGRAGIDYNVIEAVDQPWKRRFEGAMGGAWGIADVHGQLRDTGVGPLPPDPAKTAGLWGALGGALVGATMAGCACLALPGRRPVRHAMGGRAVFWGRTLAVVLASAVLGLMAALHASGMAIWLRSTTEWAQAMAHLGLALGVCGSALWWAARAWVAGSVATLATTHSSVRSQAVYSAMLTALLVFCTVDALTLVFDGRYRALQAALMGATAFGLCMARLSGLAPPLTAAQGALALALGLAAPVLLVLEGVANQQAVGLAAAWVVMAACLLWRPHRQPSSGLVGP